jgi:two-component system cell cycle sensor histidine kinase/response regulator CckA
MAMGMPSPPNGRVVLLVDDEVMIRNMIRLSLHAAGFHVIAAADGHEALILSRDYRERIDVLVTDVDMPKLDGISLAGQLKTERPDIQVVVMSGRLSGPVHVGDAEIPVLCKPFSSQTLIQMIHAFFLTLKL